MAPSLVARRVRFAASDPPPGSVSAKQPSASSAVLVQALAGQEVLDSLVITDDAPMSRTTGLGAAVAAVVLMDHGARAGAWGPEELRWDVALPLYEEILVSLAGEGARITRMQPRPAA